MACSSRPRSRLRTLLEWTAVLALCAFVAAQLHPELLVADTTATGGDMGAHVWSFGYLLDELLPSGQLTGWAPDWYAGFPAFHFYMIVPFLLMAALASGATGAGAVVVAAGAAGAAVAATRTRRRAVRRALAVAAVVVAVGGIAVPATVAFKLGTVAGVVTMPAAAYRFARRARLADPAPVLCAAAVVLFLFDRNFSIYGGNVASTLAGEFAFSIALSAALVFAGSFVVTVRDGTHRAASAALFAVVVLSHLIVAVFAGAFAVAVVVTHLGLRTWRANRRRLVAAATVGVAGSAISAFWTVPFWARRELLNDMGWEPVARRAPGQGILDWVVNDVLVHLVPAGSDPAVVADGTDLRFVAAAAAAAVVVAVATRDRVTGALATCAAGFGVAFAVLPAGRLWNARLLPFWYLCLYLLAAVAAAHAIRGIATVFRRGARPLARTDVAAVEDLGATVAADVWRLGRRARLVGGALTVAAVVAVAAFVGGQTRSFPIGTHHADGSFTIAGLFHFDGPEHYVRDWAAWNYAGYEAKDRWGEHRELIDTMRRVGAERGCGRSLWEYSPDLNDYGTPMALMLLPHWTGGCVGSMEGLYFEASATTPFHFLTQSELSAVPSRPQRDLPYGDFDIDGGVAHLQDLGVRYYLAQSSEAKLAAAQHPDLVEVARSGPWVIYQVRAVALVEGLAAVPARAPSGAQHGPDAWLCATTADTAPARCSGPAVAAFTGDGPLVVDGGLETWPALADPGSSTRTGPLPAVAVTDVAVDRDRISFRVDRPGVPVLVKVSYFPNWDVEGAAGPWRAAPNFMVVVPDQHDVTLTYGPQPLDWGGRAVSAAGLVALAALAWSDRRRSAS